MPSPESLAIRAKFTRFEPNASPVDVRRDWEAGAAQTPLPAGTQVTAVEIAALRGEWVDAPGVDPQRVLLFLHGGGYNCGAPVTHREMTSHLSAAAGARVLLPAYRLAPEEPFPAAVEDAGAAYMWLLDQGIRPEHIAIAGDSAGGGLAVATLLWLRERELPQPAAGVLLSPWADLSLSGESLRTHAHIDPLTSTEGLRLAAGWYATGTDLKDPLLSPVFADLAGLPPLLILVGSDEVLLSDATRLAQNARTAGVDTALEIWQDMWHVWIGYAEDFPERWQAIERIGAFIRERTC